MNKTSHRVIFGDARDMSALDDASVRLIVTSPPYWQLKDYGDSRQIGFDDTYEAYVNNLNLVWLECARVLHPGCRLCINVGDQFARAAYYGRYKVIPIRTEIIRFCETVGFDFMGAIVWQKATTCHTTGGAVIMGSYPYPRNGIVKLDYEHILLFKRHGKPPRIPREVKQASRMTREQWNQYFYGHWNFSGEKQSGHLAMFPVELPRRLIRMFSFVGETVLDPFLGSGTTSRAAIEEARSSVGFEVNGEFRSTIEQKLHAAAQAYGASVAYEGNLRTDLAASAVGQGHSDGEPQIDVFAASDGLPPSRDSRSPSSHSRESGNPEGQGPRGPDTDAGARGRTPATEAVDPPPGPLPRRGRKTKGGAVDVTDTAPAVAEADPALKGEPQEDRMTTQRSTLAGELLEGRVTTQRSTLTGGPPPSRHSRESKNPAAPDTEPRTEAPGLAQWLADVPVCQLPPCYYPDKAGARGRTPATGSRPPADAPPPDPYARLPYIFRDPLKLDKRTDPRQRTYGSRISKDD